MKNIIIKMKTIILLITIFVFVKSANITIHETEGRDIYLINKNSINRNKTLKDLENELNKNEITNDCFINKLSFIFIFFILFL